MSSIEISITKIEDAVDTIKAAIETFFGKSDLDLNIESELYKITDTLRDDLWVLIEYPYVDKVYRDSYYTYFASKHNTYHRDCIRVSFFTDEITLGQFRSHSEEGLLQKKFVGYLIIRPTFHCPIGRSLLNKKAFADNDYSICDYIGDVSVNGVKLRVQGFPHCSQDTESISCAETTIWSIMEYFGNKYADYRPTSPSQIVSLLNEFSKQRLLPSTGLTVDEISFALKEFGFGSNIYSREEAYGDEIENIIAYYIESGIPVIAAVKNETVGHAIAVIGRQNDSTTDLSKTRRRELEYLDTTVEYIDYTDISRKYIVNDDNLAPYRAVDLGYPVEHYDPDGDFKGCIIEAVVVPLYKKIYLEVIKARALALTIISDKNFGYKFSGGFVFRFFLASSRSFKEHVFRSQLNDDYKDYLILTAMPKFIWCAEIYDQADLQDHKVAALVILDATEANQIFIDSLIFAGYPDRTFVKDDDEFVTLKQSFGPYHRFRHNLH